MTNRPYYYGLGKRKTAIARVRLYADGEGKVTGWK
jgi:ribosomal protein S9